MIIDYFKISIRNIKEKKMRSFLTLLGIFIAVLTIFVLMSLSLGLNNYVQEQFKILGTDKFFIQPKGSIMGIPGTSSVNLSLKDVNLIEKVKGVNRVSYSLIGNGKLEFGNKVRYYMVLGVPLESQKIKLIFENLNLRAIQGRILKKGDKKKVLLGYNYGYKKLFGKNLKPGDKIKINGNEFKVIGILSEIGNPGDDQNIYISENDFKKIYGDKGLGIIYIKIDPETNLKEVSKRVERKLMKFRGVDEDTEDFEVQTPEEILESFNNILNILTAFLVGIGLISILVGGIGIANTMYTSVLERKKEIGTMKAIGAKNSDILLIFVIESGLLGFLGGLIGLTGGIIVSKTIEYFAKIYMGSRIIQASMNFWLILGSLAFAFLIGLGSGVIPSYQASKLKPAETLRYE